MAIMRVNRLASLLCLVTAVLLLAGTADASCYCEKTGGMWVPMQASMDNRPAGLPSRSWRGHMWLCPRFYNPLQSFLTCSNSTWEVLTNNGGTSPELSINCHDSDVAAGQAALRGTRESPNRDTSADATRDSVFVQGDDDDGPLGTYFLHLQDPKGVPVSMCNTMRVDGADLGEFKPAFGRVGVRCDASMYGRAKPYNQVFIDCYAT